MAQRSYWRDLKLLSLLCTWSSGSGCPSLKLLRISTNSMTPSKSSKFRDTPSLDSTPFWTWLDSTRQNNAYFNSYFPNTLISAISPSPGSIRLLILDSTGLDTTRASFNFILFILLFGNKELVSLGGRNTWMLVSFKDPHCKDNLLHGGNHCWNSVDYGFQRCGGQTRKKGTKGLIILYLSRISLWPIS